MDQNLKQLNDAGFEDINNVHQLMFKQLDMRKGIKRPCISIRI